VGPITCPQCGREHSDPVDFCSCNYPLFMDKALDRSTGGEPLARRPGERFQPDPPGQTTQRGLDFPVVEIQEARGPTVLCPLGHPNEPSRTLCCQCGERLQAGGGDPTQLHVLQQPGPTKHLKTIIVLSFVIIVIIATLIYMSAS